MQVYVVGGAVRDQLLGRPVQDRDYVVVGATPEQMVAQGYRPVGKDFPVFLHPRTQDEYALARTERKSAPGYRGFVIHAAPDVTLEQDLIRRDLTINAIAMANDGTLCDPFGGVADIERRIFRHVSDAFGEDPVRILRLARFAARYADFTVAPETMALMRQMVRAGEVDALVPERVWQELARGLGEAAPSRMLAVLRECGALARIMPELDAAWSAARAGGDSGAYMLQVADHAAARGADLPVRFAALMLDLDGSSESAAPGPGGAVARIDQLCKRLKVPNECRDLAVMSAREHAVIARAQPLDPEAIVALFERCDGFRKPQRFEQMLLAAEYNGFGDNAGEASAGAAPPARHLNTLLGAARAVNAGEVAQRLSQAPQAIPLAVHAARVAAVAAALNLP